MSDLRLAIPGGRASDVLAQLDSDALGLARARVAARLGNPPPFDLRAELGAALLAGSDPVVERRAGAELSADAADAALVRAALGTGVDARNSGIVGLFAGRSPGPCVRAIPVDDPQQGWLRFARRDPPPPPRWGKLKSWSTEQIGDEAVATVRTALAVPGGAALGSDYGLTMVQGGKFTPFPWPAGCRREARRVEALALSGRTLLVATSQSLVEWDGRSEPRIRKHGQDDEGGWDELRCMAASGSHVYYGWRTRFEGGRGPADVFSMTEADGVFYAGCGDGSLHVVDGGGPIRPLARARHQPVRHLAFADGTLHVAAGGLHHRFDGASWEAAAPEPTAFGVDRWGRLWLLAEGRLWAWTRAGVVPIPVALDRPWCLAPSADRLWIGGKERVWSLALA